MPKNCRPTDELPPVIVGYTLFLVLFNPAFNIVVRDAGKGGGGVFVDITEREIIERKNEKKIESVHKIVTTKVASGQFLPWFRLLIFDFCVVLFRKYR